MTEKLNTGAL